jgi:hypothetical protein
MQTIGHNTMVSNKIKNIGILALIFILSFFVVSCEEDDNSKNGEYGPIESDILFTFAPDSADGSDSTGNIVLYLKTEMIYGCINFEIVYEEEIQIDRIDIDLEGVVLPGKICLTALGPARAKIPLGNMVGEFNLYFSYNSSTDNHYVLISDSSIVVTPVDTSFTRYLEYSAEQWW